MLGIGDKVLAIAGGASTVILAGVLTFVVVDKNATIRSLESQATSLKGDLNKARESLTTCRNNRITLEEATRRQNEAVRIVREESEARVGNLKRELANSQAKAREAQEEADRIMATPGTGDVCADAEALILEEAQ